MLIENLRRSLAGILGDVPGGILEEGIIVRNYSAKSRKILAESAYKLLKAFPKNNH